MELIRSLQQLRPNHRGCVATIGNFDGVHRGHQSLLKLIRTRGAARGVPSTVIIFEPQPIEFFAPKQAPARLTRFREKLEAMRLYDIERVLSIHFTADFANLSAEQFIQHVLVDGLAIQHLVVGDDFQFGRHRQGNFQTLQHAGARHGFSLESQPTFIIGDERVSSTRVRAALAASDFATAQALLGRPYAVCGRVRHGQQLGRTIGFPTANLFLHRNNVPMTGVFAVYIHGVEDYPLPSVANLGRRPTIGGTHLLLEVHIFNFNQMIYGDYVQVEFVRKIRDEQRFTSLDALQMQIQRDVQAAQVILHDQPSAFVHPKPA